MSATTKTPITKEQWQAISEELKGMMPIVNFELNGREISIRRERKSESKSLLAVYVDDYMRGAWTDPKSEKFDPIAAQVWFKKTIKLYSAKKKADMEKKIGKRRLRKLMPNIDAESIYYMPYFGSSRTLIGQYKKVEGLSVTKIGYENKQDPANRGAENVSNTHA
jgi:hypothetical protein